MKKINKRKVLKKIFTTLLFVPSLSLLSKPVQSKTENKADLIVVWKTQRRMTLFHKKKPIKSYFIRLGLIPKVTKGKKGTAKHQKVVTG